MNLMRWDNTDMEFKGCPFCGAYPKWKHVGNDFSKKRSIEIKRTGCRIGVTVGAIHHDFAWIEEIIQKNWNKRVDPQPEIE